MVFLGNHRAEQLDNLLRTLYVGLEIAQVGAAVAVFLAGNLAAGHFFDQRGSAAHHFARREGEDVDFLFQLLHVGQEFVGHGLHTFGGIEYPQRMLDAVEAAEAFVFLAELEVVGAGVDGGVELVKQLGNRLDALVVGAHVGKHGFGIFGTAGLHGFYESRGFGHQLGGFVLHVNFIVGQRFGQFFHIGFTCRFFEAAVGYHQFAARVVQQAAGHFVFARQQGNGHFVAQAGGDVFALVHHHHTLEDFPLQLAGTVVFDVEHHLAAGHGELHRVAGVVVYRNIEAAVGIGSGGCAGSGRSTGSTGSGCGGLFGGRRLAGCQAKGGQYGQGGNIQFLHNLTFQMQKTSWFGKVRQPACCRAKIKTTRESGKRNKE